MQIQITVMCIEKKQGLQAHAQCWAECKCCGARQAMQLPTFQLLLDRMSELYSANMSVIQLAQVHTPCCLPCVSHGPA